MMAMGGGEGVSVTSLTHRRVVIVTFKPRHKTVIRDVMIFLTGYINELQGTNVVFRCRSATRAVLQ